MGNRLKLLSFFLFVFVILPFVFGYSGYETKHFHPIAGLICIVSAAISFVTMAKESLMQGIFIVCGFVFIGLIIALLGSLEPNSLRLIISDLSYGTKTIVYSVYAIGAGISTSVSLRPEFIDDIE